jgi:ABC-type nickel/cobalt efflux system permease component RcnA
MTQRLARFLLFFAALWMPVQTMAALSMAQCRHVQEQAASGVMSHEAAASAESSAPCHEAVDSDQATHHEACDNCESCHLASAGFLPSADLLAGLMPAENRYVLPAVMVPRSHIAEPPQHPPRSAA